MKVLITLPVKIGFDGMTKQVLSYGKYMNRDDLEIDLLSCRGFDPKMKDIVKDSHFNKVFRLEYRDTNQFKYFVELYRIMRKRKYDVIHANGQSATLAVEMLAAALAGCKLRVAHSHNSMCIHQKAHKLLKPLFKLTCNDAIACSKEAGNWLFENKTYWVLKNGIDIESFKFNIEVRKKYREKLGLNDDVIAVGNVAAFEPKKNHLFIIDAFKQLKGSKYRLFLWGIDGSSKDEVLKKIKKEGLEKQIIYMGTTDEINNYLQAMDLMLLPSLFEGFPVTVVEWQANGLRCLVSDTITNECNINGLVKFLPIDKGSQIWANEIIKYGNSTEYRSDPKYQNILKEKGFDIAYNANELKKHYIQRLKRK